jgi:hypothetical protein
MDLTRQTLCAIRNYEDFFKLESELAKDNDGRLYEFLFTGRRRRCQ